MNMTPEICETDIAVPQLPNKRDGYIGFHFLPGRQIEAQGVAYPTMPRVSARKRRPSRRARACAAIRD